MKNRAFTLAEVVLVMVLMGIIAIALIRTVKVKDVQSKTDTVAAYKAINLFDQASFSLRDIDSTYAPTGAFIQKTGKTVKADGSIEYSYERTINVSNAADIRNAFATYVKFDSTYDNFCTYSGYCDASETYPGGRIGDIYIGFELLENISDCPNFYMPEAEGEIAVREDLRTGIKPKCWAKIYIDTNGNKDPNTLGNDVYIFGIDELGLHH